MHLIFKCVNLLKNPLVLKSYRNFYTKLPEVKPIKKLHAHIRCNRRAYTTISLCAAGATAFITIKNPSTHDTYVEDSVENSPLSCYPYEESKKSKEVNVLSCRTLFSLMLADLPYLIMAILVNPI